MPLLTVDDLRSTFRDILLRDGLSPDLAEKCVEVFTDNTRLGVYSHGVNRFPRFVEQLRAGHLKAAAKPVRTLSLGAVERWDGGSGIGIVNAREMSDRAMELATEHGVGLVAIGHTNHWMRGGTWGGRIAERGFLGICWTNTIAIMPPWGGTEPRVGNNPLVIGVPGDPPTIVDMACSLFSWGKLDTTRLAGGLTPVDAGYDAEGKLSRDPAAVLATQRLLPTGFWKGSGLSIVLDMAVTLLSGGLSVAEITADQSAEFNLSQVFVAVDIDRMVERGDRDAKLARIREYVTSSAPVDPAHPIRLPGHDFARRAEAHDRDGVPVADEVWERVKAL